MKLDTTKSKKVAAFFAVAVILIALTRIYPERGLGLFDDGAVFYAISPDAYGTVKGSPVRVHGVEVGVVTAVELVQSGAGRNTTPVRIAMRISEHGASFLKERTVAHVERVHMGTGVPPFAKPPIELWTEGQAPLPVGSVLETIGDETMVESFAKLSRDVGAVRKQLQDLSGLFDDARVIAKALAGGEGAAGKLLHDPATAESLTGMLRDARATTTSLSKLVNDARALSDKAPPLIAEMRGMSQEGRKAMEGMNRAAGDLPRLLKAVERTLKLAEELAGNLRTASVYAPELARKVDASIEETNRLVDAAQRSVILRSTLPEREYPRTESEVRPPIPIEMDAPE
ncbi:MAG TPA: MlaD family protein [Polyangiaceae bacterium]|nr:MlaD family protein [Polyangiaceae bacterium]